MIGASLRRRLSDGERLLMVNAHHVSSGLVARLCELGADTVFLDCEHGSASYEDVRAMAAAARVAIRVKAELAMTSLHKTFQKALAKGVKIGLGTDAAVYPHGRNAEEFHQMVDLGMKPIDALRAGTSADADLLGLSDKIGTLEAGKSADIVAVPGNPLENIRQTEHVVFVMKEGVVYKDEHAVAH